MNDDQTQTARREREREAAKLEPLPVKKPARRRKTKRRIKR